MSDTDHTVPPREAQPGAAATLANKARRSFGASDSIATIVSVIWLVLAGGFFLFMPSSRETEGFDSLTFVMTLFAVFMPIALIWIGTSAAKQGRIMREESGRLQAAIDGMRQTYVMQQQSGGIEVRPVIEKKLDDLMNAQRKSEAALERIASRAGIAADVRLPGKAALPAAAAKPEAGQPALALGTPAEALAEPISVEDFTRALHFPQDEKDQDGFRALRRALRDHTLAGLIHSAQDVLTLLSEDGIYMDDLVPERTRPESWRRFAAGERGANVSALGAIRDRSSLALTSGRMRQDPIFRDAVHHFLRKFDHTFASFEKSASDADITAVVETRTARAFMLLGRVSGTFD
ncbi:hypothetical protein IV417_11625 [Alphaproteobacteria bacterium KMM 3653]|uniref:Uncharacterized protein n=1 Tax=Harenicola maris TaxID=2841044 RepID=A0AAP2CRT3_9RHOB|nr:hypothetical protein [Harenicola maris]